MVFPDLDPLDLTDLRQYARNLGYRERPADSLPGFAVLEHPGLGDCVAIVHLPRGDIYARIHGEALKRHPGESDEQASSRLRRALSSSTDTGLARDFVRSTRRALGLKPSDADGVRG